MSYKKGMTTIGIIGSVVVVFLLVIALLYIVGKLPGFGRNLEALACNVPGMENRPGICVDSETYCTGQGGIAFTESGCPPKDFQDRTVCCLINCDDIKECGDYDKFSCDNNPCKLKDKTCEWKEEACVEK
jgi:hypothetical protein